MEGVKRPFIQIWVKRWTIQERSVLGGLLTKIDSETSLYRPLLGFYQKSPRALRKKLKIVFLLQKTGCTPPEPAKPDQGIIMISGLRAILANLYKFSVALNKACLAWDL